MSKENKKVKPGVVPTHFFGHLSNMKRFFYSKYFTERGYVLWQRKDVTQCARSSVTEFRHIKDMMPSEKAA